MTMLVWAACDNFALMMSDRRTLNGRIVAGSPGSGAALGELTEGEADKWTLSPDARDVYTLTGAPSVEWNPLAAATDLTGQAADRALFSSMHASEPLDEVLDEALLRLPNAILHGYSYRNRMICSRIEWGVGKMHWSIFAAPSDKVVLVADGSGRGYVQGIASADHAQWSAMEQSVGDWRAVRDYALRLFRAVTSLDRAVGPDVDTWVMTKDDRVWRRPDAPERGETS